MGIFGGGKNRGPQPSARIAGDENVTLTDPDVSGDPRYAGLKSAGLSFLVYGPHDLGRCFAAITELAPAFQSACLVDERSTYIGGFEGHGASVWWTAMQGPDGSAISIHCFRDSDSDFVNGELAMRLRNVPEPWRFGIGTVNARVPAEYAEIFRTAEAVPVHVLPGLGHLNATAESQPEPPQALGGPADNAVLPFEEYRATVSAAGFARVTERAREVARHLTTQINPAEWKDRNWRPGAPPTFRGWLIGSYLSFEFGDGAGDWEHSGTDETVWILRDDGALLGALLEKRNYPHQRTSAANWEYALWPAGFVTELRPIAEPEDIVRMERGALFEPSVHAGRRNGRPGQRFIGAGSFGDTVLEILDGILPRSEQVTAADASHTSSGYRPAAEARPASAAPSLAKGANVSLSKQAPGLRSVSVGLGWDVRSTTGAEFDLDASAIATGTDRRVLADDYFVFFNNLRSPDGAIVHAGDNTTGAGEGDDETIDIDLIAVAPAVTSVFFLVSIYDADARRQSFGQVQNAYIRIVDSLSGKELARFDLSEDASTETAIVFGELYRRGEEWKFRAIGQGYTSGLGGIARDYGVNVG